MELEPAGVSPADLVGLHRRGAISDREYGDAIEWASKPPSRGHWAAFLRDWFLLFGLVLVVSGVILFGAFNWSHLGRLEKLGLLELLVLGAWMGSRSRGLDSREGRALLWAASALVGALLAVFGQVYQTGADSYTLFAVWAVLIFPWSLAARTNVMWASQAVLLDVAFVLFCDQRMGGNFATFSLAFAAFNLALLALWEAARRRSTWMRSEVSDALIAAALWPLTGSACTAFWDGGEALVSLVATLALYAGLRWRYGRRVSTMTIVALSAIGLGGALLARIFFEVAILGSLVVAMGILGMVTLAARWLKAIDAQNKEGTRVEVSATASTKPPGSPDARHVAPSTLETLHKAGLLDEARPLSERALDTSPPKYLSVLVGFGAWLSSWFVLSFMILLISESEIELLVPGLLLWAGSIAVRRSSFARNDFVISTCLSVNLAGQLLCGYGIVFNQSWPSGAVAGFYFSLHILGLILYADDLGRRLFAFAAVLSGGIWCHLTFGEGSLAVGVFLLSLALSRLLVGQRGWLQTSWRNTYGPLVGGLSAGLLTLLAWYGISDGGMHDGHLQLLTASLTLLTAGVAISLQAPVYGVVTLLVLGALTASTPGLIAATLVFLLAFHTRSPGLSQLSVVALMLYGILYYYNLDISFLQKSAALLGAGIALLIARSSLRLKAVPYAL